MYYNVRIITFIILFTIFLLVLILLKIRAHLRKKKPEVSEQLSTNKKAKWKHRIATICIIFTFIAIILVSLYPFEGYFITFDTIEDSLSYRNLPTENICIFESANTVFVVTDSENDIFTIEKVGGKFKLAEFQCKTVVYPEPHSRKPYVKLCSTKYNESTNETFYFVRLRSLQTIDSNKNSLYENITIYKKELKFGIPEISLYDYQSANQNDLIFYYIDNNPPMYDYELNIYANNFECTTFIMK